MNGPTNAPPLNSLGAFVTKIHTHTNPSGRHEARTGGDTNCPLCEGEDTSAHWLHCTGYRPFVVEPWAAIVDVINKGVDKGTAWVEKMVREGWNPDDNTGRSPQPPDRAWLAREEHWKCVVPDEVPKYLHQQIMGIWSKEWMLSLTSKVEQEWGAFFPTL